MNIRKFAFSLALLTVTITLQAQDGDSIRRTESSEKQLMSLARQYRFGIMREVNPKKAASIYNHLSKKGNDKAMNELGRMYLNGDGVERSPGRAMKLFTMAANKGNVRAMCNLAFMYQKGIGTKINYRIAFRLYKKASDMGSSQGDYGVGYFLYKGLGTEQSYDEAVRYLERGASKGHGGCNFLLGSFYANGFGEGQDIEKAEEYFYAASKTGSSWAADVKKHGLLDTIAARKNKVKALRQNKIPTPVFLNSTDGAARIETLLGRWEGMMYTYDWSNTKITDTTPIACEFENFGDSVAMMCYMGDSLLTIYTPFERRNYYVENKWKSYQKEFNWIITKCQYERRDDFLTARLRSLNTKNREYRRPMVMSLHKVDADADGTVTGIQNAVFNNDVLELDINSAGSTEMEVRVYTINGELVKKFRASDVKSGSSSMSFSHINMTQGMYIVEVVMKGKSFSKKITVK